MEFSHTWFFMSSLWLPVVQAILTRRCQRSVMLCLCQNKLSSTWYVLSSYRLLWSIHLPWVKPCHAFSNYRLNVLITSPFVTTECINIQDELYGWCCIGPRYLNKVNPVFVDFFTRYWAFCFCWNTFSLSLCLIQCSIVVTFSMCKIETFCCGLWVTHISFETIKTS